MNPTCKRDGGPMVATSLQRGGTLYTCVVCGHSFVSKPKPTPAENATDPLADEPRRWWHS